MIETREETTLKWIENQLKLMDKLIPIYDQLAFGSIRYSQELGEFRKAGQDLLEKMKDVLKESLLEDWEAKQK